MIFNKTKIQLLTSLALGLALIGVVLSPVFAQNAWVAPPEANGYKNIIKSTKSSIAAGKKVYDKYCAICHGATGAGDGPSARTQRVKPANLRDKSLMGNQSDGALAWKILNGRGPMPSWAPVLNEPQVWNVINYIRALSK